MTKEHRSRPRTNLRTPVYLFFPGTDVLVESETENVSRNGFFCRTREMHAPGERFRFLLCLSPRGGELQGARPVYMEGVAEVVHVKIGAAANGFGVGCRVEGYHVLPQSDIRTQEDIRRLLTEPYRVELDRANEVCFEAAVVR